eukprot:3672310-Prymnesium_polylepis.2
MSSARVSCARQLTTVISRKPQRVGLGQRAVGGPSDAPPHTTMWNSRMDVHVTSHADVMRPDIASTPARAPGQRAATGRRSPASASCAAGSRRRPRGGTA